MDCAAYSANLFVIQCYDSAPQGYYSAPQGYYYSAPWLYQYIFMIHWAWDPYEKAK